MYSRILVPLDHSPDSEQVLPYARRLALSLNLPITLITAVEPEHPNISRSLNPALHQHETTASRTEQSEAHLEDEAAKLRAAGCQAHPVTHIGMAAEVIVEEADQDPGTLIAMSSHGRSGLARWWLGSVTDKVLHLSTHPMLLIKSQSGRAEADGILERLVIPTDGSELAEQVIPYAADLAASLELGVDLVMATPSQQEFAAISMAPMESPHASADYYAGLTELVDADARQYLEGIRHRLAESGLGDVEIHHIHNSAPEAIIDVANAGPHRLVAMTTHGRSGVSRLVLGSVAERVVRQSGDPVLLIRANTGE